MILHINSLINLVWTGFIVRNILFSIFFVCVWIKPVYLRLLVNKSLLVDSVLLVNNGEVWFLLNQFSNQVFGSRIRISLKRFGFHLLGAVFIIFYRLQLLLNRFNGFGSCSSSLYFFLSASAPAPSPRHPAPAPQHCSNLIIFIRLINAYRIYLLIKTIYCIYIDIKYSDKVERYLQSAKILLLPPKYVLIMMPSNHSNSCRTFSLLKALAKRLPLLFANAFIKSVNQRQILLSQ